MLKVDDWIANGFEFDEEGYLSDDGICRLHASGKGDVIARLMDMHGFKPEEIVSVGDSEMDLSMMVEGSQFIGFNPSRESSLNAFTEAGVPIVTGKGCLLSSNIFNFLQAKGIDVDLCDWRFTMVNMHGLG